MPYASCDVTHSSPNPAVSHTPHGNTRAPQSPGDCRPPPVPTRRTTRSQLSPTTRGAGCHTSWQLADSSAPSSEMRPQGQRQGDAHLVPQQQIVGFHVEGQSPSPSPASILQDSMNAISSGSPTPVIIPPQFQVGKQRMIWRLLLGCIGSLERLPGFLPPSTPLPVCALMCLLTEPAIPGAAGVLDGHAQPGERRSRQPAGRLFCRRPQLCTAC
jgi:hypothetical protein